MHTKILAVAAITSIAVFGFAASAGGAVVAKDSLRVEPSGKKAVFVVAERNGELTLRMLVKKDGRLKLLREEPAPSSFKGSKGFKVEVGQEGETYTKNGGQGLLTSNEDANYFGWDIDRKGKLVFY